MYKRTRPKNMLNPVKDIVVHNGSEGPKCDPYGYIEYRYCDMTLHLGALTTWAEYNKIRIYQWDLAVKHINKKDFSNKKYEKNAGRILIKRFEKYAGITLATIDKYQCNIEVDPLGCPACYE